ncbi:MAG: helicase-exonuclease AddAB subunit AddA [Candidatus Heteroscillospira sp.]
MAKIEFTPSQKAAIFSRDSSVLVSAAAGSGKTRVLTERLMAYITDGENPRDIDSFLIITYTRAAAAELRGRILSELMARSSAEPENRRLRRQANLCYRAQIGTIHSFCTTVLRENAHSLGISPDFRVLDEDRASQMRRRALENTLEKAYEDLNENFRSLVDTVGAGRDDRRLENVILSLHEKMQSHPDPERWAMEQKRLLDMEGISDAGESPWGAYLLERAAKNVSYWARELEELILLMNGEDAPEKIRRAYSPSIEETALSLRDLERTLPLGWDKAREKLPIAFPRLGALRASPDPELSDRIKSRREACKKSMEKLNSSFAAPSAELLSAMKAMAPAMQHLLDVTLDFSHRFAAEKRRSGCVDFSDLEHLAAKLLTDEHGAPTYLAKKISQRYTEIMVDEYQDVNAVQDMLFHAVSREGKNLFMVGDVKQSIYRFRLADPGIFLDKYARFSREEQDENAPGRKILLRENFRSRACVLNAANHVFKNIMSRELGELDYDEEASLKCGAGYYPPEGEAKARLEIVELPGAGDEDSPDKTLLEARTAARRIRELIEAKTPVFAGGGARPAEYGDIVILLRSPGAVGEVYAMALAEEGIPVSEQKGGAFFTTAEVSAMISLLAVIDNPHQDVPLISALRSVFFGFTADELAQIRACRASGSFFDALRVHSQTNERSADFLKKLEELRGIAPDLPTDTLLRRVYNSIDAMAALSAMEGGERRRRNLLMLLEYAGKFEAEGFRGLFKFVAALRRMLERGEEPPMPASDGGGGVTIMSIHKSKGLEFPIVFLCDTARRFNRQDMLQPVLVHAGLGLGPKFTDRVRGIEYPTIARRAISEKMNDELLSEEMRVLYVALTRAKERLFITCAMKIPEKTIEKLRQGARSPIPPQELAGAQSMAHWLIQTALLEQDCMELCITQPEEREEIIPEAENGEVMFDEEAVQALARRLEFVYPHAASVALPSKLTATELKEAAEADTESQPLLPAENSGLFRMPELGRERALTGAEKGTATHLVMQYINFAATGSLDAVKGEISRLEREGYLSPRQAAAVDARAVLGFFSSGTGRRVLGAERVLRETPFSLLCDAGDYFEGGAGDSLLLQGVIDCAIEENGEITIIDYKTDYVNSDNLDEKVRFYAPQVRSYARAMRRLTGKSVMGMILYFLRASMAVLLDENGENKRILP